ncbi:hypothetical protein TTHERM_01613750 (macronuclear) [Tetrahymena thermophila SB210]|uniref:Uncharacterized protein n=1 Tax=Tetrahymena thermophila (strain SB210) TaxID=312017 RepID=Q228A9_TETTS|nr:hypothetical protein TTHERM_01613750 [Tetrahymena thermophila SB210]EAR81623.2 hypothetical protein TTHERM_01613750 [Tetrahymena thermophila SB210]|eukprot:XP_001029286.2 hypothetical protein TTHERM_01613750 [Tetrahymena thermophila SB210]
MNQKNWQKLPLILEEISYKRFTILDNIDISYQLKQIYGDGIKVNTFSNKQEAPIILGSDEDGDNFDENDDNDNDEDAAEENEDEDTNRNISKQNSKQNKKQNNKHIERNETNLGMIKVQIEEVMKI